MLRLASCLFFGVLAWGALRGDAPAGQDPVKVIASGLPGPAALAVAENGTIYVALERGGLQTVQGSAASTMILEGKQLRHVAAWKNAIFACDHHDIFRITSDMKIKTLVEEKNLTELVGETLVLGAFALDEHGNLFVAGNSASGAGALVRIHPSGKATMLVAPGKIPELKNLGGVASAGETAIIVQRTDEPRALLICTQKQRLIAEVPWCAGTALEYDSFGRMYGINSQSQRVMVLPRPGAALQSFSHAFKKLSGLTVDHAKHRLLAADGQDGSIISLPLGDPAHPVDETPLPLTVAPAFSKIKWAGWQPINDNGVPTPHRPIVLTHANDQSHRNFVATQHGVIHVFPNKPDVEHTKIFLDIQKKVTYSDSTNEEGFLGLAFHPRYKTNGEFFVFYSPNNGKRPSLETIISRFRVSQTDPDQADPQSEEILLRFKRPFWNHDGGTLCFGPDGLLYIGLGDGGAANDPFDNGQNLKSLLGSILRIDVDRREAGKPYGIPPDNPFVADAGAQPEIFAYGIRNVWRLAFDRKTGQGWWADVGQNLYEEVNLLHKGGNYGWNRRESFHPFGPKAMDVNRDMIEPLWEYHHRVGKSITGGFVYRGKGLPDLDGHYLYADYVSGKIWGLRYDFTQQRVTANREIAGKGLPIMSFGEDEDGEAYLLTFSGSGQGIDRLVRKK